MTDTTVHVSPDNAAPRKENALEWIKINHLYFKTVPGILKIAQAILGIICMACASPAVLTGTHWFLFVVVTSFIATLIWIAIYLISVREALTLPINWILTELINTVVVTVLYFIAFVVQLSVWSPPYHPQYRDPNIAAGIIGIINTLAYAAGSYFLFVEWKATRVISQ